MEGERGHLNLDFSIGDMVFLEAGVEVRHLHTVFGLVDRSGSVDGLRQGCE
jgi:hypothetical protein